MQLVDSYLVEISRFLPEAQREDILVELRSTIEEQISDSAAGDNPTLAEQKAILNRFGHPLKVASEYQQQKYLIGPALFPTFVETMKTVYSILIPVLIAVYALSWITLESNTGVRTLLNGLLEAAFWATAVTIGVFAALEYSGDRFDWYERWNADSLSLTNHATTNRSDIVINLISEAVFLLWWNDLLVLKNWFPGFGESHSLALAPAWTSVYWPLNFLAAAWFVTHVFVLFRGAWTRISLQLEIALALVALTLFGWLLMHQPLVDVSGDVGPNGSLIVNRSAMTVIVVFGGIVIWDIYLAIKRLRRGHA